jgi:hypothetical protein
MSIDFANDTPTHPRFGSEQHEPASPCQENIVRRLRLDAASLSHVNLQMPLDQTVEDLLHTHGLDMTLLELERQMHRVRRLYASQLAEAYDDGDRAAVVVRGNHSHPARDRDAALFVRDEVK